MPAPERDHSHASQRACAGRVTVRKRAGAESPPHQTQKLETTSTPSVAPADASPRIGKARTNPAAAAAAATMTGAAGIRPY